MGHKHLLAEVGTDSHSVALSAQILTLTAKRYILNPDIKAIEPGCTASWPQFSLSGHEIKAVS